MIPLKEEKLKRVQEVAVKDSENENIKLGVLEDSANRTRLAKLRRFTSSNGVWA